jgi:hypothetical protein
MHMIAAYSQVIKKQKILTGVSAVKKRNKNKITAENSVEKSKLPLQRFPSEKLYKSRGTGPVYVTHILLNSVGF